MDKNLNKSPTVWTRPADVMKMHRVKKRALQARMLDNSTVSRGNILDILGDNKAASSNEIEKPDEAVESRLNPFRRDLTKRFKASSGSSISNCDLDASNDNTLFQLLNQSSSRDSQQGPSKEALTDSFADFLDKITGSQIAAESLKKRDSVLPIDWSLKSKVRFFSKKPLPWNQNLKMLDEASGTTAFARCMDLKSSETSPSISTGINAQLQQTCLTWQHPALPWLSLFPRTNADKKQKKISTPLDQIIKDALHNAWRESFRSLLQLVRAHQCPYFYLCANKFTCLVRAAGIGGFEEINAIISPTTSGFRRLLQNDEISFTLPLQKEGVSSNSSPGDLDESRDGQASDTDPIEETEDEVDDEEAVEWLQSIGVAEAEIKKLNSTQSKIKNAKTTQIDQKPSSTVVVQTDAEVMALFNLLLNCRSITTTIGTLAGIPPTLLAPVAFHGATLVPLLVGQKTVNMKGEQFFSAEIVGPVLPHTLRELCAQLEAHQSQFSMTSSIVDHSKAFSTLPSPEKPPSTSAFAQENLRDCGLTSYSLKALCQVGPMSVLAGVKFQNSQYVCHD
ncbi:protein downstream neighbor of son homolog [Neocloeon triangulifer]|uniref:protein downstream neighbor of son homolog n=1 Tax=Neocloeon triangulifer TaxID=2078957 RepID=UPI00286ED831|nr:protein downstream neighbor of son homolog [Neocloeon triangulifer]XP_059475536.1 protein downstream neighbor of son homolog [Neocloeon triangulifer]